MRPGLFSRFVRRVRGRSAKRPCIVLTGGEGGYGNLGDELLLRSVLEFYAGYLDRFEVVVAMMNPPAGNPGGFVYIKENAEGFSALDPRRVALLHYYGGGYLNRYWYEPKIALYRHLVSKGLAADQVAFTGQGLGPFVAEQVVELAGIAKGALVFGTRDRAVVDGVGGVLTFDESIALYSPEMTAGAGSASRTVALNIRTESYVGVDDAAVRSIVGVLDGALEQAGWDAVAFGMVANERFDEGGVLHGLVTDANARHVRAVGRPDSFEELAARLAECRVTLTTSYHVALVSLYVGTPVVALYESEYYRLKFTGLDAGARHLAAARRVRSGVRADRHREGRRGGNPGRHRRAARHARVPARGARRGA